MYIYIFLYTYILHTYFFGVGEFEWPLPLSSLIIASLITDFDRLFIIHISRYSTVQYILAVPEVFVFANTNPTLLHKRNLKS